MKTKDIQELSVAEIEKKIRDTRAELLDLRLKKQTGQVEKTHKITEARKDIARMETIRSAKIAAEKKSA
ncbi:50S ribosomal protein L29 [Pelagicoccus albus]|uniref:Large ribosomal subunit protein uL29 n=1 Tax=Pelagicoccus albus TaxID=415222 RepID=A0A7X1B6Q1_9BACT|nr:50S ribosomal protein L29 [Pelagicoccus albus]MBC2606399.1 50S ribosomal protein L29 [Pelagicoccus albus]